MPELPEVETIRSDLEQSVVGKKITGVNFLWPGILKGMRPKEFSEKVIGQKIISVNRRAKNLDIKLSNGYFLLLHMKMTGHLILTNADRKVTDSGRWVENAKKKDALSDPQNQFIRMIFSLDNGKILAFSDLRKFGYLKLLTQKELENSYDQYGPEPLSDLSSEYLAELLRGKNTAIKKILMDQKTIAGIGNIYADEILWESRVHPLTPGKRITNAQIKTLNAAIKKILKKAIIARGTSSSDYRDLSGDSGNFVRQLKVYRRNGEPCSRCQKPIERISVGGRGTHFCSKCQKEATS